MKRDIVINTHPISIRLLFYFLIVFYLLVNVYNLK